MKYKNSLSTILSIIIFSLFLLIITGCTKNNNSSNYDKYKEIEKDIIGYQITRTELINKLGKPKYNLHVNLPEHNFYTNILVYEITKNDSSKSLVILKVREDDNNKIDPNIKVLNNEQDMLWPGFNMTLEDAIQIENRHSEKMEKINSSIASSEEIITSINTVSSDYHRELQGNLLNEKYISNLKAYKNVEEGFLLILFDWGRGGPINASFLIRLFDHNGNYLDSMYTKEMYNLFSIKNIGNTNVLDEENPLSLIADINSIILPEVKYLEFGILY
jgi:hypothetical protein